jgi:hypothetical protein
MMMNGIASFLLWIVVACVLGFGLSAVFSGWLDLRRRFFLIPYVALVGGFLYTFTRLAALDLQALVSHHLLWGVLAGLAVGTFMVMNVRSQPSSRGSTGGGLLLDIAWLGVVYGGIDALFLNVMPVLAVLTALSRFAWTGTWLGKAGIGLIALCASLAVTLAYHLGYREFRNKRVGLVLVGNAIITLGYLLSGNPLAALIGHIVMHLAAAVQGPETTIQLPPHRTTNILRGDSRVS